MKKTPAKATPRATKWGRKTPKARAKRGKLSPAAKTSADASWSPANPVEFIGALTPGGYVDFDEVAVLDAAAHDAAVQLAELDELAVVDAEFELLDAFYYNRWRRGCPGDLTDRPELVWHAQRALNLAEAIRAFRQATFFAAAP